MLAYDPRSLEWFFSDPRTVSHVIKIVLLKPNRESNPNRR